MEVAASAIAIITLVGNVSTICLRLYGSLGAREELNQIIKELEGLRQILTVIAQLTSSDTGYAQICSDSQLGKVLTDCEAEIKTFEVELGKVEASRLPGLSLPWLLKEKALARRLETLSRLKQNLQLSMQADQTSLQLHAKKADEALRESFAQLELGNERRLIVEWLNPASFSSVCDDAQKIRSANTFTWLLESSSITTWRDNPGTSIWLHGIPGCGKTVFASSVVETLTKHCQQDRHRVLAYHFFEFASRSKGTANDFLRSVLSQIVAQKKEVPVVVQTLYKDSHEGARGPSDKVLLDTLGVVLEESQDVYLIVDAVDECEARMDVAGILQQLALRKIPSLHLMVTSRSERDFEQPFQDFQQISLVGREHNDDIRKYIEQRISEEKEWSKWPTDVQEEIAKVVVSKAEDMFRLAKLHLDALQKCKTRRTLQQTMRKLPSTLDDTYARILDSIDADFRPDALRILGWLCFALRPPTLTELAAALAVDLDLLEYDPMLEYQDTSEIMGICSSLVKRSDNDGCQVVKLSHASVRDYLVSGTIGIRGFDKLFLDPLWVNEQICAVCLVYLNAHNNESEDHARICSKNDSLIGYAANFWSEHFRCAGKSANLLRKAEALLLDNASNFVKWAWIGTFLPSGFHVERLVGDPDDLQTRLNASLYLSVLTGSIELIDTMLKAGAHINGFCGAFESALAAATIKGDLNVAKHLLDAGADVNARAGIFGRVLHMAAARGRVELVDLFLFAGAAVNATAGVYRTPLIAAMESEDKRIDIVFKLLQAGADASDESTPWPPLTRAVIRGDKQLLKLLIEFGADCNRGSLHVALVEGQLHMAQMLIDVGADLGLLRSNSGAAAAHSVSALDFEFVDCEGRNALHIAAAVGSVKNVRYLLDLGMQADSKDKKGWSALHYAAASTTADCLRMLIPLWTLDTAGWTPLHLVCRGNNAEAIDLLLEAGLQATPISTVRFPRKWTLLDIAIWHENRNLVSSEGHALHPALRQDSTYPIHSASPINSMLYRSWHFCDGCQPTDDFVTALSPLFQCKECEDHDYCMICVDSAAHTHPHSSWELLHPSQTPTALLKVKHLETMHPVPLDYNPLKTIRGNGVN